MVRKVFREAFRNLELDERIGSWVVEQCSNVKTDDVTSGRKDVDLHGRFRGEWEILTAMLLMLKCK